MKGLNPKSLNSSESLLAKVVFPEEEGPATKTIFAPFSFILSAMAAIFLLWRSSHSFTYSLPPPVTVTLFISPRLLTPKTFPQVLYSSKTLKRRGLSLNFCISFTFWETGYLNSIPFSPYFFSSHKERMEVFGTIGS